MRQACLDHEGTLLLVLNAPSFLNVVLLQFESKKVQRDRAHLLDRDSQHRGPFD